MMKVVLCLVVFLCRLQVHECAYDKEFFFDDLQVRSDHYTISQCQLAEQRFENCTSNFNPHSTFSHWMKPAVNCRHHEFAENCSRAALDVCPELEGAQKLLLHVTFMKKLCGEDGNSEPLCLGEVSAKHVNHCDDVLIKCLNSTLVTQCQGFYIGNFSCGFQWQSCQRRAVHHYCSKNITKMISTVLKNMSHDPRSMCEVAGVCHHECFDQYPESTQNATAKQGNYTTVSSLSTLMDDEDINHVRKFILDNLEEQENHNTTQSQTDSRDEFNGLDRKFKTMVSFFEKEFHQKKDGDLASVFEDFQTEFQMIMTELDQLKEVDLVKYEIVRNEIEAELFEDHSGFGINVIEIEFGHNDASANVDIGLAYLLATVLVIMMVFVNEMPILFHLNVNRDNE